MTRSLARALVVLAGSWMGEGRRQWAAAMEAEFEVAAADGRGWSFAVGCLAAGARAMLASARGRFVLTSHAVAIGVILPMAALQLGCALFGLPYLYPNQAGLPGAMLEGAAHEPLIRGVYQGAIPALALVQVIAATGHVRLAWALLERDWPGVVGAALWTLAATVTLVALMGVLFLDSRQALLQGAVLVVELAIFAVAARWHDQLFTSPEADRSG